MVFEYLPELVLCGSLQAMLFPIPAGKICAVTCYTGLFICVYLIAEDLHVLQLNLAACMQTT